MFYELIATPVGDIIIVAETEGIVAIDFQDGPQGWQIKPDWQPLPGHLSYVAEELRDYVKGKRQNFSLQLAKGTAFQQKVWQALIDIPYGQVRSYSDIAMAIGQPTAVRAVASANARNPYAIVVPCHRVIGKNGTLTGYAGGLQRKQWLLKLEQQNSHEETMRTGELF